MSLFEELKRRNVFRVGIAYAISAWVLLQIVDLVLENITAPGWIMQVFMLALGIGFPVALIFAWAFEMTPDGVKLERDVDRSQSITHETGQKMNRSITIVLVIAVMFLLADKFWPESETTTQTAVDNVVGSQPELEVTEVREKSIAILPFVDMSPDGDQAYFADGISEEILNVLVKTRSLKVAGRTSSFQFRNHNTDLKTIGKQLGVEHILEGSIRKADNRVRITAQLVSTDDGFHLWSETYDRELTDIFAIQDEIARAITTALAIELNLDGNKQSLVTASTTNMDAYDRYLEARGLISSRLNFPRAINLLNEATAMDPEFAAAWSANAQAHALFIYYSDVDRDEWGNRAEVMAKRALEIEPQLSTAHSVLGDIYRDRYQWSQAQKSYLRALELNPDDVEANEQYAQMLQRASYFDEALRYSEKATRLDPLSWLYLTVHASLRYQTGDHAGAWSDMHRVMKMDGADREFALRHAVRMSICDGDVEQAIHYMNDLSSLLRVKSSNPEMAAHFLELTSKLSTREEALAHLTAQEWSSSSNKMISSWQIDVFWAAFYGDFDLAEKIMLAGTELDAKMGILDTGWLNYPVLNPLHNSPPYKNLIRRIGLDEYWRENRFPRNCRPVGEDDFACN